VQKINIPYLLLRPKYVIIILFSISLYYLLLLRISYIIILYTHYKLEILYIHVFTYVADPYSVCFCKIISSINRFFSRKCHYYYNIIMYIDGARTTAARSYIMKFDSEKYHNNDDRIL